MTKHWRIRRRRSYLPVDIYLRLNWRNWALPVAFGGGIWEDWETGDYGAWYGCEVFRSVVVSILCISLKLECSIDE